MVGVVVVGAGVVVVGAGVVVVGAGVVVTVHALAPVEDTEPEGQS